MIDSTISSPGLELGAEGAGDQIRPVSQIAREDDLVLVPRIQEPARDSAGLLEFRCRRIGEKMQAAMHVGILELVGVLDGIEDRARLLSRRAVVEIHQRFAVDFTEQDRKIGADAVHVEPARYACVRRCRLNR